MKMIHSDGGHYSDHEWSGFCSNPAFLPIFLGCHRTRPPCPVFGTTRGCACEDKQSAGFQHPVYLDEGLSVFGIMFKTFCRDNGIKIFGGNVKILGL